jgi:TRAP transporter TAXI family solute receptor
MIVCFWRSAIIVVCVGFALATTASFSSATADSGKKIIIGSGGKTGVYYPVALAICRLFNANNSILGADCGVESTGGSIDNLNRLRTDRVNFAIVQSDWLSHAHAGTGRFKEMGPHRALRSVFSLHSEAFTIVAKANPKIAKFVDLKGQRVNIGNTGSGQRATMETVMKAFGWTRFTFSQVREFSSKYQSNALCDGEVDAIVFVAGHPSGSIKDATTRCRARLIDVVGEPIDKLIADNKHYSRLNIPKGMYRGQDKDVETFGVSAVLVATSETPDMLIDGVVRTIFENLESFKKLHPALANLDANAMRTDGLSAPLHEAASAYFAKIGS